MKKSTPILLTIIAILFVTVLYLLFQNLNKTTPTVTFPVPDISIIPTQESLKVNTYTNSQYKYSLQYPTNWTKEEQNDGKFVRFYNPSNSLLYISVDIKNNLNNLPILQWLSENKITGDSMSLENITVDNTSSIKIVSFSFNSHQEIIYVPKAKYIYQLSIIDNNTQFEGNNDFSIISSSFLYNFKFTDSIANSSIPKSISDLFNKINKNFNLSLVPLAENESYSPSGMTTKKSWKIDFVNTALGKSLTSFLRQQLEPNDAESGGTGGGGTDAYQNNQIKCFHTYGYRSGDPTNWTDPYDYLSCTEK